MWVTPLSGSTSCGRPAASSAEESRSAWATTTLSSARPCTIIIGRTSEAPESPSSVSSELYAYTSGWTAGSPR